MTTEGVTGSATVEPELFRENNPIGKPFTSRSFSTTGDSLLATLTYAANADVFAFNICAKPVRLTLISARGARITTGS